jgi:hypothetical protein
MKKILSCFLSSVVFALILGGCADIKPGKVGSPDAATNTAPATTTAAPVETAQVDKLLAPPTPSDLYNDKNVLSMTSGSAEVDHADGTVETVTSELAVAPGDTIKIKKGLGVLTWFDDSISRLKEGTVLEVSKAEADAQDITETHIGFKVVSGEVWNKVRALVDQKSDFLSYAGSVVSGVRGSVYNVIVNGDKMTVESIEHAAFVAQVNSKTMAFTVTKNITQGQMANAVISGGKAGNPMLSIGAISSGRLKQDWILKNSDEDQSADQEIRRKNLDRMLARAGALPGEPGYEEKTKEINQLLESTKDPLGKSRLEIQIAELRANEALALALKNPSGATAAEASSKLGEIQKSIDSASLSKDEQQKIKSEAQTQLKMWDRSFEGVLPNETDLFKAKDSIRNGELNLAPTPEDKEQIQGNILKRKYFELNDAAKLSPDLSSQLKQQLEQVRQEYQKVTRENPQAFDFQLPTVDQLNQINQALQQAVKNIPELKDKIPSIDSAKLQQIQEGLKQALPLIQQMQKSGLAVPKIDPSTVNLLNVPAVTNPSASATAPTIDTTTAPAAATTTIPSTGITSTSIKTLLPTIKAVPNL